MKTLSTLATGMALAMTMGLNADAQDRDPKNERERAYQEQERNDRAMNKSRQDHMRDKAGDRNQNQSAQLDQTSDGFLQAKPVGGVSIAHLIGSSVRTPHEDDEIGEVEDIVIDRNGRPLAVIISVGGFLGVGDRDVALGWDRVTVAHEDEDGMVASQTRRNAADRQTGQSGERQGRTAGMTHGDPDDYVLVVDVNRDVLKNAPEFDRDWD